MADRMQSNLTAFASTLQSQLMAWEAFMDRQLQRMHQLELGIQSEQADCKENISFAKQQIAGLQSMTGELAASQGIQTLGLAAQPPEPAQVAEVSSTQEKLPTDTNSHHEKVVANEKCKRQQEFTGLLYHLSQFNTRSKNLLDIQQGKDTLDQKVATLLTNVNSEPTEDEESFKGRLKAYYSELRSLLYNLDDGLYVLLQSNKSDTDDYTNLHKLRLSLYKIVNWSTDDAFKQIPVTKGKIAGSETCPEELEVRDNRWYTSPLDVLESSKMLNTILAELRPGYMYRQANNRYYVIKPVMLKIAK